MAFLFGERSTKNFYNVMLHTKVLFFTDSFDLAEFLLANFLSDFSHNNVLNGSLRNYSINLLSLIVQVRGFTGALLFIPALLFIIPDIATCVSDNGVSIGGCQRTIDGTPAKNTSPKSPGYFCVYSRFGR